MLERVLLAVLLTAVSGYGLFRLVQKLNVWRKERQEQVWRLIEQLQALNGHLAKADAIGGYMIGLVKVAEAQVAAVEKQTTLIGEMKALLFADGPAEFAETSASGRSAFGTERANLAWAADQAMRAEPNLSLEEIEERAHQLLEHGEITTPGY